jgi:hypothetical protein
MPNSKCNIPRNGIRLFVVKQKVFFGLSVMMNHFMFFLNMKHGKVFVNQISKEDVQEGYKQAEQLNPIEVALRYINYQPSF